MIIRNDRLVSKHGLHSKGKFLPVRKWFVTPVNDGKTFSVTKRFPARERDWAQLRRGSTGGSRPRSRAQGMENQDTSVRGGGVGPSGLHRTLTAAGRWGRYRGGAGTTGGRILSCPSGILAKTGLSGAKSMSKVMAKTMVQNGVSAILIKVSPPFHHPPPATGPTSRLPISVGEGVGFTSSGAAGEQSTSRTGYLLSLNQTTV